MAATMLGSLLVSLGLESGEFKSGLDAAEKQLRASTKRFEKLGSNMSALGQKLSLAVSAPLAVFAKKSVEGFVEQEKAMADVNAALKSMGDVSGKTSAELLKTADALEMRSLFDAEVILKQVTANLLTFGNVANEQFDRAQQAAVDMATRLGTEPQSAAIMLGKALNDPIKGISALTRVGVQFTDQQKKQIEAMVAANNIAGAQGVILSEVERQFKGAAAAAADASPWRKAQVAIGQAMDTIGAAILPIIKPIAEAIAGLARAFSSLPEPMQKVVVVAGILAAALGPLLMIFGPIVSAMAPFLATIKAIAASQGILVALRAGLVGLATTFGPILIAVGAIYLAWQNWDKIAPRLQPLINQLTAIGEGLGLVEGKANKTAAEIERDEPWVALGQNIRGTSNWLQKLADDFDNYNARTAQAARDNGTTIQAGFQKMWQAFDQWWTSIKSGAASIPAALANMANAAINSVNRMVSQIGAAITGRLTAIWEGAKRKVEEVRQAFFNLWDKVTRRSYVPDMVDDIAHEMQRLQTVMVQPAKGAIKETSEAFRQMAADVAGIFDRLFPEAAKKRQFEDETKAINDALAAQIITADAAAQAIARLRREYAGLDVSGPNVGVSEGLLNTESLIDPAKLQQSIDTVGEIIGRGLDTAKTRFSDFKNFVSGAFESFGYQLEGFLLGAQSAGDALRNLARELASMALRQFVLKPLGNALGIPGFASGTNFAPGGLSIVGERGPELVNLPRGSQVIPNHNLRQMGGGGNSITVNVSGAMNDKQARETGGIIARRIRQSINGIG